MNSAKEIKREIVTYRGIQCGLDLQNIKPILLVNISSGSTVAFNPKEHRMSIHDLHRLKEDINNLSDHQKILLVIGK